MSISFNPPSIKGGRSLEGSYLLQVLLHLAVLGAEAPHGLGVLLVHLVLQPLLFPQELLPGLLVLPGARLQLGALGEEEEKEEEEEEAEEDDIMR